MASSHLQSAQAHSWRDILTIITLTQFKGGVGKTSCAICLATLLSQTGKTLLIDSDPNRSATLWSRKGKLPFTVVDDIQARKELMNGGYTDVVIDTPARPSTDEIESLASGCDLLILPSTPDPLALSALAQIVQILPQKTNYRCLLTIVPPSPQKDGAEALEALNKWGFPVFKRWIRRYKAYIRAADAGTPVKDVQGGGIAWRDWLAVKEELNDVLT